MIYASFCKTVRIQSLNHFLTLNKILPNERTPAEWRMIMTLLSAVRWQKEVVIVNCNSGTAYVLHNGRFSNAVCEPSLIWTHYDGMSVGV